jgi:hypothetical protein
MAVVPNSTDHWEDAIVRQRKKFPSSSVCLLMYHGLLPLAMEVSLQVSVYLVSLFYCGSARKASSHWKRERKKNSVSLLRCPRQTEAAAALPGSLKGHGSHAASCGWELRQLHFAVLVIRIWQLFGVLETHGIGLQHLIPTHLGNHHSPPTRGGHANSEMRQGHAWQPWLAPVWHLAGFFSSIRLDLTIPVAQSVMMLTPQG